MTAIYTITIFLSAFLIFLIQPMLTKLLLPYLGGGPSVWNTSMAFYQFLLLSGYIYAHLSIKILGIRLQAIIHVVLVVISLIALPITLNTDLNFTATDHPTPWLLGVLLFSIGAPFMLLSANAPLLQKWLASTTHKARDNPYFLYSASNLGSLVALLSYPIFFEPLLKTSDQTDTWSIIYVLFTIVLTFCAFLLNKNHHIPTEYKVFPDDNITLKRKLRWVILAFIPSSLMLGVTNHITTDVASFPLLWIIPLSIYLLSFIFAFAPGTPMYERSINAQVSLVTIVVLLLLFPIPMPQIFFLHFFTFFAIAMVCHGKLSRDKPNPKYLTEFFLWLSLGGVLGGIFNAIVAPLIFSTVIEYKLLLVISCLFLPAIGVYKNETKEKYLDILLPLFLFFIFFGYLTLVEYIEFSFQSWVKETDLLLKSIHEYLNFLSIVYSLFVAAIFFACLKFHKRPLRFSLLLSAVLIVVPLVKQHDSEILHVSRNFFGVLKVVHDKQENYNRLMHGTTIHGIQKAHDRNPTPTAYYTTPVEQILSSLNKTDNQPIAVIGLGTGTIACYSNKGYEFVFYEINKNVIEIAKNPDYFSFLSSCAPDTEIIPGDGRIEINKAKPKQYSAIMLDAFSSDSIPIHLMTDEAISTYLEKIYDDGLIALHLSNRYFNLAEIVSSLATKKGMIAIHKINEETSDEIIFPSHWAAIVKDKKQAKILMETHGWEIIPTSKLSPWTDDYSNIMQLLF